MALNQASIKTATLTAMALAALTLMGAALVVYLGLYNVAATNQDIQLSFDVLHYAMQRSVAARSGAVSLPNLRDASLADAGLGLYRQHCVQCHGAPGVAPDPFAFGLRPAPPNLAAAAHDWEARDIYWAIKHGLSKTAMPAWEFRLSEQQLWQVTAFVTSLPQISPAQYRQRAEVQLETLPEGAPAAPAVRPAAPGDARAGRRAIGQYLCATCHVIPGIAGIETHVGPALAGIASRPYIAGVLANTPANMLRWLRDPQQIDPLSAMPNLRIRESDLRDIAAYLATLDDNGRSRAEAVNPIP